MITFLFLCVIIFCDFKFLLWVKMYLIFIYLMIMQTKLFLFIPVSISEYTGTMFFKRGLSQKTESNEKSSENSCSAYERVSAAQMCDENFKLKRWIIIMSHVFTGILFFLFLLIYLFPKIFTAEIWRNCKELHSVSHDTVFCLRKFVLRFHVRFNIQSSFSGSVEEPSVSFFIYCQYFDSNLELRV